jgi:hypothetical protein
MSRERTFPSRDNGQGIGISVSTISGSSGTPAALPLARSFAFRIFSSGPPCVFFRGRATRVFSRAVESAFSRPIGTRFFSRGAVSVFSGGRSTRVFSGGGSKCFFSGGAGITAVCREFISKQESGIATFFGEIVTDGLLQLKPETGPGNWKILEEA